MIKKPSILILHLNLKFTRLWSLSFNDVCKF